MSENFYEYAEILDRNDRSIRELMQIFRISRGKYDFVTQFLDEPEKICSGIPINAISPIKIFWHQFVINKLKESNKLSIKEKDDIKDGFCYTLAMDWLFQKEQAELHYLPPKISKEDVESLWNNNGSENYYIPLAKRFTEYIDCTSKYKNEIVSFKGVDDYEYEDFEPIILFDIDDHFSSLYYLSKFNSCSLLIGVDTISSIININNNINKALFRLIMHIDKQIIKHTVAMQKVITADGQELYHFFDPNFGVYEIQNKIIEKIYSPLDFFFFLLGKYKYKQRIYVGGYISLS